MSQNSKKTFTANARRWMIGNRRILFVSVIALLFSYLFVVKGIAATRLDYYSDEPDDYGIVIGDAARMSDFFKGVSSADQARFPHLVALPIIKIWGENSLLMTRMLYIVIHLAYLFVIYKLFRLSLSKVKALYGLALTALSAYLFSFSVFSMTTGSSLFLLLGTLILYMYLRYLKAPLKAYSVNLLAIFGVVSGLAVASRFFAALILISVFLYDAWLSRKNIFNKQGVRFWSLPFELINVLFTVFIIAVNVIPASPTFKLMASIFLALVYIALFAYEYITREDVRINLGFFDRWLFVVHTAFVTTLIASPIHLNIKNIVRVFEWSSIWHKAENYINPSRFDIFTIIGVKTGWLAAGAILLALGIITWRRQLKSFAATYALFIILIVVNMLAFLKVTYVIVWYPLLLMPFFYLPLAYVFPGNVKQLKRPLGVLLLLLLLFIPLQEQYRYWRVFPYGHADGAQYGKEYIGWNKPGTITFESSRQIISYIKENQATLPPGEIDCQLVTSKKYNPWASGILTMALQKNGLSQYKCRPENSTEQQSQYALTTVYIPEDKIKAISKGYKQQKVFTQASIPVATLWVKK